MQLPCIKFINYLLTYLIFIAILLTSVLYTPSEKIHRDKFSEEFPLHLSNFINYTQNKDLKYRFIAKDFYIRKHTPYFLDVLAIVWLLGKWNFNTKLIRLKSPIIKTKTILANRIFDLTKKKLNTFKSSLSILH
jgi:hypothetical protein